MDRDAIIAIGTLVILATRRMPIHEIAPPSEVHPPVTVGPVHGCAPLGPGVLRRDNTRLGGGRNRFLTLPGCPIR